MKQGIPSVDANKDLGRIEKMISALEYQLTLDTRELDKEVHRSAINALKERRNVLLAEKKSAK